MGVKWVQKSDSKTKFNNESTRNMPAKSVNPFMHNVWLFYNMHERVKVIIKSTKATCYSLLTMSPLVSLRKFYNLL